VGEPTEDLEELFREHAQAVLAYAIRRGARPEDAGEILSEVMLVAWRRLDEVPRGPEARFWMLATARLAGANQARSERRRTRLGQRLQSELEAAPGPSDGADEDLQERVRAAMKVLPEADREVLLLAAWEELRPSEIAQVLSIPPETARTRLHRARARLRAELAPSLADEGRDAARKEAR